MTKFTDNFFRFPIKSYNEDKWDDEYEKNEKFWVTGSARIPFEELSEVSWWEGLSKGKTVDDYLEKGTDVTIVYSINYGYYVCTWPIKKFEEKLNEFMAKIENEILKSEKVEEDLVI